MPEWIFYIDVYNKNNRYVNSTGKESFSWKKTKEIIEKYSKEWEIKFKDDKPRFTATPDSFRDVEAPYFFYTERYVLKINLERTEANKLEEEIKNHFENLSVKAIPKKLEITL